jgi:hypothetical protein
VQPRRTRVSSQFVAVGRTSPLKLWRCIFQMPYSELSERKQKSSVHPATRAYTAALRLALPSSATQKTPRPNYSTGVLGACPFRPLPSPLHQQTYVAISVELKLALIAVNAVIRTIHVNETTSQIKSRSSLVRKAGKLVRRARG